MTAASPDPQPEASPRKPAGGPQARMEERIAEAIPRLLAQRPPGASISPSDVAMLVCAEAGGTIWQPLLGAVRRVAARLAGEGALDILRKGRKVAPGALPGGIKGVIRLRLPQGDEPAPPSE
jgi:hypothetical protein